MTLKAALRHQAEVTEAMGSPFTARLLRLLAARLAPGTPLADRLLGWEGDISARAQSVPLRIAGALHGLVLEGHDSGLAAVYPPNDPADDALWAAIAAAFDTHAQRIDRWLDSPPQTNELGRSAVLIAAAHLVAELASPTLDLLELGASAGLNLFWDHYALKIDENTYAPEAPALALRPDWTGRFPPATLPLVATRRGVDLNPLDVSSPADRLRMRAYIWPDQSERLARTEAALTIARPVVDRGDAADWIAARLAEPPVPGRTRLIYHTVAWQYFPEPVKAACTASITAAGAAATAQTPLAWLGMEDDGKAPGAGLSLRLWPGNRRFDLGRADFHARWVDWTPKETT